MDLVELGHSERRQYYHENDWDLNKKVCAAQSHGMIALLCIGENAQEKAYGVTEEVLRRQMKIALRGARAGEKLWIAYEPVWAIGEQGVPAQPDYVEGVHGMMRRCARELFGGEADELPLLYGGSVNPENCAALAQLKNVDGLFIGRSAWDLTQLKQILQRLEATRII